MKTWMRSSGVWLAALLVLVAACTPPPPAGRASERREAETALASGPKRMTAAIRDVPPSFSVRRTRPSGFRGIDGIEELASAGMTHMQADGGRSAQLAEAVPTLENGAWKVFPDGRMETTWKIKQNARWHDGTAFTSDDIAFTAMVEQDRAMEIAFAAYELIESISTPDPRTVVIAWKRPYIEADWMFSYSGAGLPMPKHLLEGSYNEDKTTFLGLPYWNTEFVGLGPFKVHEWAMDSHVILRAYNDYVLGRPKIDEIEVKFILDNNTLFANVLAGVDLTLGKTITLDMALPAKDQWKDGKIVIVSQNWTPINPQWINPDPIIISNYQFRKALFLDLDRQQLADFVFSGYSSIAHSYVNPNEPMYNVVEPSITKYPYDPQQAAQILEGLGFVKRADGLLYDAEGKKLAVTIQIPLQNDLHAKTAAPVADSWRRLGLTVEEDPLPAQRAQDREFRSQYLGFNVTERVNSLGITDIWNFHSSRVPLPENRYLASGFAARYRHPQVDAALERFATAIPMNERMAAVADLVRHQTENLSEMPLFYGADPTLMSNRLMNVTGRSSLYTQGWNAHLWDIKG